MLALSLVAQPKLEPTIALKAARLFDGKSKLQYAVVEQLVGGIFQCITNGLSH